MHNNENFNIDNVATLIFSGGGNRCWWQAGFVAELISQGWTLPKDIWGFFPIPVLAEEKSERNFSSDREAASTTLTLLTRHFEKEPTLFSHYGKRFIQPSRKIPVSTFYVGGCTADTTVDDAFELGQNDARGFIKKN